jgi:hypothetical protein
MLLGEREHRLHHQPRAMHELRELIGVGAQIRNRPRRHAALHRGFGDRRRDLDDQRGSNGFGMM